MPEEDILSLVNAVGGEPLAFIQGEALYKKTLPNLPICVQHFTHYLLGYSSLLRL